MTTPDIDQAFFEEAIGAATVARYFDDDGSGAADATLVERFLKIATRSVRDDLAMSFSESTLDQIRANEHYQYTIALVAISRRAMTRQEWMLPDGTWPYESQRKDAEKRLDNAAKGIQRLSSEATTNANPMMRTRGPLTVNAEAVPIFAPSAQYPSGRGGF
jgi:hypothetical protein